MLTMEEITRKFKLDNVNEKLLWVLLTDARAPLSKLAKKFKMSKIAISKRISSLEKNNVVTGYTCFVDFQKLGFNGYQLGIKTKTTVKGEDKIFFELLKDRGLSQILKLSRGKWDFLIRIYCRKDEIKDVAEKISQIKGIEKIELFNIEEIHINAQKGIKNTSNSEVKIDKLDLEILHLLSRNGRIKILDIAKKFNKNAVTIKNRIRELERKELILFYVTNIDVSFIKWRTFLFFMTIYGRDGEQKLIGQMVSKLNSTGGVINSEFPNIFTFHTIKEVEEVDVLEKFLLKNYPNVEYEIVRVSEQSYYEFFPESLHLKLTKILGELI